MKVKAAVLTELNKPLEILEVQQEGPKAGEVRVRVKATGVCMSDWHLMVGDWPTKLPMVLGHEAAGIVEEVGPNVTNVKRDDHIIFSFRPQCGHCPHCSRGRPVLCSGHSDTPGWTQFDGTTRLKFNGEAVNQMSRIGTFTEFSCLPCRAGSAYPQGHAMGASGAGWVQCRNRRRCSYAPCKSTCWFERVRCRLRRRWAEYHPGRKTCGCSKDNCLRLARQQIGLRTNIWSDRCHQRKVRECDRTNS